MPETKELARVAIYFEIEGEYDDAYNVIDALLDNGVPQDSINEHEIEDAGPVHVKSAVVRAGSEKDADLLAEREHALRSLHQMLTHPESFLSRGSMAFDLAVRVIEKALPENDGTGVIAQLRDEVRRLEESHTQLTNQLDYYRSCAERGVKP